MISLYTLYEADDMISLYTPGWDISILHPHIELELMLSYPNKLLFYDNNNNNKSSGQ